MFTTLLLRRFRPNAMANIGEIPLLSHCNELAASTFNSVRFHVSESAQAAP